MIQDFPEIKFSIINFQLLFSHEKERRLLKFRFDLAYDVLAIKI